MMKLYWVEVAPNPTKVRLYIAEKTDGGAVFEIEEIRVKLMKGEQHQPDHLQRNPFGTVPVLEISPGDYLIESLSIIDYLEECFPTPNLLGESVNERAKTRQMERLADLQVLTPIGRYIHATNSPVGRPVSVDVANQARQAFEKGLGYLEAGLAHGREFLMGERLTLADCTLAAGLQFARFANLDLLAQHPNLQRWDVTYRKRDAARRVLSV